jgi:SAM-dependent methyltransferase
MLEWRRLGAADKALHITRMCEPFRGQIFTVLDVGCGTGDVLRCLNETSFASTLNGVEITSERSALAREGASEIEISPYDGRILPFENNSIDLVYTTHVLEHVFYQRGFLRELRRVARKFVFIEVPLELHLRTNERSLQRSLMIGHINAYNMASFQLAIETSGLRILALRVFDQSLPVHSFNNSDINTVIKVLIRRAALAFGAGFATRVFTYHCAALCQPADLLDL